MAVFKHEGVTAYLSIEHLFNAIGSTFFGTGMSVAYVPNIMTIGALWFIPCMMLVSMIMDFFIIRIKKDYIKGVLSVILLVAGLIIRKDYHTAMELRPCIGRTIFLYSWRIVKEMV